MPYMQAANDAANGLAGLLLTEAPIGAKLTSVALFIDGESTQARLLLPPMQVCRNLTDATCRLHTGLCRIIVVRWFLRACAMLLPNLKKVLAAAQGVFLGVHFCLGT